MQSIFRPQKLAIRLALLLALIAGPAASLAAAEDIEGTMIVSIFDYLDGSHKTIYDLERDNGEKVRLNIADESAHSRFALATGARVRVSGVSGKSSSTGLNVSSISVIATANQRSRSGEIETSVVSGTRKAAIVLANFAGNNIACTASEIDETMYTGTQSVRALYEASSRGQLTWERDSNNDGQADIFGPYTISSTGNCDNPDIWGQSAQAAAEAAGVDFSPYQHLVVVLPENICSWAGKARLSCGDNCTAYVTSCQFLVVWTHELGHNLGMYHASTDTNNDGRIESEYGDGSCQMGNNNDYYMFNAPHQYQLGWLDAFSGKVQTVSSSGSYNLAPLEGASDSGSNPQIIRIEAADNEHYFLSYRREDSGDGNYDVRNTYNNKLNIHRHWDLFNAQTRYISALDTGESFEDSSLNIKVCNNSSNATALNLSIAFNGQECGATDDNGSGGEEPGLIPGDSDGDGVTDTTETADGTNPNDPGSYLERLSSPVYTLWNSFLGMDNILEMINPESSDSAITQITVELYSIDGSLAYSGEVNIGAGQQYDLVLNSLPGFLSDSYGIVKLTYTGTLIGRMSYYKSASDGSTYDFAYSVPLAKPLRGNTGVSFNTFQPSANAAEFDYTVLNWLTIVNLSNATQSYTINTYGQTGELLETRAQVIPEFGRVDIDGGHGLVGAGVVGYHEIIPQDATAPYIAQLVRYGTGATLTDYLFAFTLSAHAGNGQQMYVPLSRQFSESNWVEIINTLNAAVDVDVTFYDASGNTTSREVTLDPYAQVHYFVGDDIMANGQRGHVVITPGTANSIIAQTMLYHRDASGSIDAMSGIPAREPFGARYQGSYNLFLSMQNWLAVSNTSDSSVVVTVTARSTTTSGTQAVTIEPKSTVAVQVHDSSDLATVADTYGFIQVEPDVAGTLVVDLMRVRYQESDLDFAFPTEVRAE